MLEKRHYDLLLDFQTQLYIALNSINKNDDDHQMLLDLFKDNFHYKKYNLPVLSDLVANVAHYEAHAKERQKALYLLQQPENTYPLLQFAEKLDKFITQFHPGSNYAKQYGLAIDDHKTKAVYDIVDSTFNHFRTDKTKIRFLNHLKAKARSLVTLSSLFHTFVLLGKPEPEKRSMLLAQLLSLGILVEEEGGKNINGDEKQYLCSQLVNLL